MTYNSITACFNWLDDNNSLMANLVVSFYKRSQLTCMRVLRVTNLPILDIRSNYHFLGHIRSMICVRSG